MKMAAKYSENYQKTMKLVTDLIPLNISQNKLLESQTCEDAR